METPFWPRFSRQATPCPTTRARPTRYTATLKGPWLHSEAEGRNVGPTYAVDDVAAAEVTADVTRAGMRAALVSMQGE